MLHLHLLLVGGHAFCLSLLWSGIWCAPAGRSGAQCQAGVRARAGDAATQRACVLHRAGGGARARSGPRPLGARTGRPAANSILAKGKLNRRRVPRGASWERWWGRAGPAQHFTALMIS
jgi:hypothetical protein